MYVVRKVCALQRLGEYQTRSRMLQSSNNQYICNLLKSHFKNFLSLCFLPDSFRPEQNALRAGPDFLIHPLNRTSFLPGATTSATKDSSGFNSLVSLLLTLSFFLLLFFSPCSRWGACVGRENSNNILATSLYWSFEFSRSYSSK